MSIVSTVPLLNGLRAQGPTFYTFSGAVNDSILLFSTNNIRFNFSKFVCLKLPRWENTARQRLYKDPTSLESINDSSAADNPDIFFVKAYLQNYIENFSAIVDANRNDETYANFAEAAFWKALMSVSNDPGAVADEYKTLQLTVDSTYQDLNLVNREKFKEIPDAENAYEQVIRFVGDVNMLNHVKSAGKEYLEVYAHIPTNAGLMKNVLLKYNQGLSANLAQVPASAGPDWIQGQEDLYTNAAGSLKTYAQAVYDTADNKYNVNTEKDFLQIDWDDIESDLAAQTKYDQGSFDFNAVLLYYDIWDVNNPEGTKQRNLYGILLLDNFDNPSALVYELPSFRKHQPDANQAGNAFGFRFNLMFSNSTNQTTSEISINDYSTVSMELYMSALQRLQLINDEYAKLNQIVLNQQEKINQMSQFILSFSSSYASSNIADAPIDNSKYVRRNGAWEPLSE